MNKITARTLRPSFSIISKISFSFVFIIMLVASLVSVYVFNQLKVRDLNQKISNYTNIANHQISLLEKSFSNIELLVKYIATDEKSSNFLEGDYQKSDYNIYLSSLNQIRDYEAIYVINEDGITVASTESSFEGKNYGFRDYFLQAKIGEVYSTSALGTTSQNMGYYFSYPIFSKNDNTKFLGVVVIKLGTKNIEKLFGNRQGWDLSLIDDEGVFIYSTNQRLLLKSMVDVPRLRQFIGIQESQYLGKEIISLDKSEDWRMIKLSSAGQHFFSYDFTDSSAKNLNVAKKVNGKNTYLLFTISQNLVLGEVNSFSLNISMIIIFSAFIALIILITVMTQIIKPLYVIKEAIDSISMSNYDVSIDINTTDEFYDLGESIKNLQKKVKRDFYNVSLQVDEFENVSKKKIFELEKLNSLMVNREIELVKLKEKIKLLESENKSNDK